MPAAGKLYDKITIFLGICQDFVKNMYPCKALHNLKGQVTTTDEFQMKFERLSS